jgi:hypothetical protein
MDLRLISGEFLDGDLSKEQRYLYKYFHTDTQKLFVRYYLSFGKTTKFVDHTGCYVTSRYLRKMKRLFRRLVAAHDKARTEGDFSTIALIESGNFR